MKDLLIIGGGAAGYTAAIYASRYNLDTILVYHEEGGMIVETPDVENWPGEQSISGMDLMNKFKSHVEHFKVPLINSEVINIEKKKDYFQATLSNKSVIDTKTIIFATGSKRRKLGLPSEAKFSGRGVTYCAICDAPFYKNKEVAIIGGGDSAIVAVMILSKVASKIYLINRTDNFKAEPAHMDLIKKDPKVEIITNATVKDIQGAKLVEKLVLDNGKTLNVTGIFIEIGYIPSTELATKLGVEIEEHYIKVAPSMETSVKGIFAAGDVSSGSNKLKQLTCAAAEGTIAATSAYRYIQKIKETKK